MPTYEHRRRELAEAAIQAVDGLKYCEACLRMLYIGYDSSCNTITIDASRSAAPVRHNFRHTAASLKKVRSALVTQVIYL
jgi:hypothetical protein